GNSKLKARRTARILHKPIERADAMEVIQRVNSETMTLGVIEAIGLNRHSSPHRFSHARGETVMSRYFCTRAVSFIAAVLMTLLTLLAIPASVVKGQNADEFDIVLANGRVMDPESNTDAVRYVGIR